MKKKKNRGSASVAIFIVTLLVTVAIGGFLALNGMMNKVHRVSTAPSAETVVARSDEFFDLSTSAPDTLQAEDVDFNADGISVMQDDDVKNILLIGQDRRDGEERQRSDSMMILSINTETKEINLVSFMRDMYVQIPGYSNNRMNIAYMFGGMQLLDQVIEENFGVHIDGNVEVDFDGFLTSLAVVGNIDMTLTAEEAEYLNTTYWGDMGVDNSTWTLTAGQNSLTPEQALAYARTRYVGNSDWERTERQRKVIMAAFKKVQESGIGTLLTVADKILPNLTTDLTSSELLSYAKTVVVDRITTVNSFRIPVDGTFSSETINGMSVLVPDLYSNSIYLQHYLYGIELPEGYDEKSANIALPSSTVSADSSQTAGDGTNVSGQTGIVDLDGDGYDDNTGEYYWAAQDQTGGQYSGQTDGQYSGQTEYYNEQTYTPTPEETYVEPTQAPAEEYVETAPTGTEGDMAGETGYSNGQEAVG